MSLDIAIIGAGIGGLSCALALAMQGFSVTVYEQAATISEVGAGLQLSPNALQVIQQLGLTKRLSPFAFRPRKAVMRHFSSGDTYFSVPLAGSCQQRFGAEYWHVHRADLHRVLHQACQEQGVCVRLNQTLRTYHHNEQNIGITVELNHGEQHHHDLLVGADGIHSKVQRQLLSNIAQVSTPQFTGQVAWRGTVKVNDLPPKLVAPNANLWVGPGKHFVSYYIRGGELVNFVAVEERSDWQHESWTQEGDINQLRQLFAGWHPEVQEVLAATSTTFVWALHDRDPLTCWIDKNVALLGDACHPMLPFLAQGAAMALEDAFVLAAMLKQYPDSQVALQHYQHSRLARTSKIQIDARSNASLYHMRTATDRAKLSALSVMSRSGLSAWLAAKKLASIYGYNVQKKLAIKDS